MKLIDNFQATLLHSYVAWLVYIGTAAQLVFEFGLGANLPGWVVMLLLVLILIGRTVKQDSVSGSGKDQRPEVEFTGEQL